MPIIDWLAANIAAAWSQSPAVVLIGTISATIAGLSVILNIWIIARTNRKDRNRLLFDLMKDWLEHSSDPHHIPARELIRSCETEQLASVVGLKETEFTTTQFRHVCKVLGRSLDTPATESPIKVSDLEDLRSVRHQLFRICNWIEAVAEPYRFKLVNRKHYRETFRHVFLDDNDQFIYHRFIDVRRQHYPNIRYLLRHLSQHNLK